MQTLLVTGGAGFIGGNFVLGALARGGVRIVNLDALTYAGNRDTLTSIETHPEYRFVHGSIGDRVLVARLLAEVQPDAIVNFAAESHVDRSIDGPAAFVETNVVGTLNLLECAVAHFRSLVPERQARFRFLHVSTDEVYGSLGDQGRFTETSPYQPNSPYSASKAASDHLVRAFHHTYGLPTLTTNCSNNYGPYQFPEKLIPLMIAKALAGQNLPVYGDGRNVRDWLYVGDPCRAIEAVLALIDARRPAADGRPREHLITFVKDRPGHDRRYAIDASKLKGELGWKPLETFESGMARTVDWYLDNQAWVQRVLDGSYRGERLGVADSAARNP
jgi:dTDP-glucose 4,6-dehydratase